MKTKVSQKEWNDKRDQFLIEILKDYNGPEWMEKLIRDSNKLTSQLYEVYEKETIGKHGIKKAFIAGFALRDSYGWEGEVDWTEQSHFIFNENEFEKYYNETYGGTNE